jgi:tetratricopeptide (TPR) repeat protein
MPHRLSFVVLLVLIAVFAVTPQTSSAAGWTRLRSPHFTVEGDVAPRELLSVARRLEQFREVIGRTFPSARLVTSSPVTVLVFSRENDFKEIVPLFEGKPVKLAGYAAYSPIGESISICLEFREQAYSITYHEYAHLLISNAIQGLPLWLQEGLAEYYGTLEITEDGLRAVLGRPVAEGKFSLLGGRLLPMSELLAAGHDSKLYNVGDDRGLFYAQSWGLVHYLLHGNPDRKRQFGEFVGRLAAGVPAATAFTDAFPHSEQIESELSAYLRGFSLKATQYTFTDRVAGATEYSLGPMTPADARASVGLQLVREGRYDEARPLFEWALTRAPQTASAQTGIGLALALQGKALEALPALRKGAELADGDAMAHFALGFGALRCSSADCARESGGTDTARREFQRAVDILPEFPDSLSFLGYTEMASGGSLESAERHLLAAIAFLPGREDYRIHLAQVYMRRADFTKAQDLLGPIAAASQTAEQKALARQLLGQLSDMIRRATPGDAPAGAASPAGAAPPDADTTSAAADKRPPEAAVTPVFRTIGASERRLEGVLESILCPAAGAVVVVRSTTGVHRYWAPSLTAIDFITYRDDLKGSIGCGPAAAGTRVLVTFRQPAKGEGPGAAWIEGRVVAIEFLPKGK